MRCAKYLNKHSFDCCVWLHAVTDTITMTSFINNKLIIFHVKRSMCRKPSRNVFYWKILKYNFLSCSGLLLLWTWIICWFFFFFFFCAEIKNYEEQYHSIEIPNEEGVVTYFKIRQQLAKLGKEIQEFTHKPKYCLPFLQPGRLVKVELHTLTVWWQNNNY